MAFTYGERCWVFVCNPKKWHVDEFLLSGDKTDSWALDDRYLLEPPRPGDLALIRVGNDRRSRKTLDGRSQLRPGIYALVEITSHVYVGEGVSSKYWRGGSRKPHDPSESYSTVDWQLLTSFLEHPIQLETIKRELPYVQSQVLEQPEARSYPLSKKDFTALLGLAGLDDDAVTDLLERAPKDLGPSTPRRVELIQKKWERGSEGRRAKEANGHRCQFCEALSRDPIAFRKADGTPYVEAHHVIPVSRGVTGTLSPKNIITVCANHHRELHFGGIADPEDAGDGFLYKLAERVIKIPKIRL